MTATSHLQSGNVLSGEVQQPTRALSTCILWQDTLQCPHGVPATDMSAHHNPHGGMYCVNASTQKNDHTRSLTQSSSIQPVPPQRDSATMLSGILTSHAVACASQPPPFSSAVTCSVYCRVHCHVRTHPPVGLSLSHCCWLQEQAHPPPLPYHHHPPECAPPPQPSVHLSDLWPSLQQPTQHPCLLSFPSRLALAQALQSPVVGQQPQPPAGVSRIFPHSPALPAAVQRTSALGWKQGMLPQWTAAGVELSAVALAAWVDSMPELPYPPTQPA